MNNKLPVVYAESTLVLSKAKKLASITKKIIDNKSHIPEEIIEEWIKRLWEWADSYNIPHVKIPRDRKKLLSLEAINFYNMGLESLPEEMCNLEHLITLVLWDNWLKELPVDIIKLRNIKKLNIRGNPLRLTQSHIRWLKELQDNGCIIHRDVVIPTDRASYEPGKTPSIKRKNSSVIVDIVKIVENQTVPAEVKSKEVIESFEHIPFISLEDTISVLSIAITPDKKYIISSYKDSTIRIWDMQSGKCLKTLEGLDYKVERIIITLDGKNIVSCKDDTNIKIWDLKNGLCLKTLHGHDSSIFSISTTSDGKHIVRGGHDKTISIFDLQYEAYLKLEADGNTANDLFITPNGNHVISYSSDETIKVWDLQNEVRLKILKGNGPVTSISITSNGKYIVSGAHDKTIKVWDLHGGECLKTIKKNNDYIYSIAILLDDNSIIYCGVMKKMRG